MTSIHNKGTLKTGDYLTIELDNGDKLVVMVYAECIFVKTNAGDLEVNRHSSFGVHLRQIPRTAKEN